MRLNTPALTLCVILSASAACNRKGDDAARVSATPAAQATPAPQKSAACLLLTAEDLRGVQGEAPQDTQGSERVGGGLLMSQCFYRLPTFNKSVNVEVVRAAEGTSQEVLKEFWRRRFHPNALEEREHESEREAERERERKRAGERDKSKGGERKGREREEREEKESKPQRVEGLGEEAYWSGNQITAALSVLTKNAVVRVSVGGPEGTDEKIKKASALAQKLLKQL